MPDGSVAGAGAGAVVEQYVTNEYICGCIPPIVVDHTDQINELQESLVVMQESALEQQEFFTENFELFVQLLEQQLVITYVIQYGFLAFFALCSVYFFVNYLRQLIARHI